MHPAETTWKKGLLGKYGVFVSGNSTEPESREDYRKIKKVIKKPHLILLSSDRMGEQMTNW